MEGSATTNDNSEISNSNDMPQIKVTVVSVLNVFSLSTIQFF